MGLFDDENDDFSLDRFNLELEADRNPSLMRKYGKKLSIAAAETKDTKRELEYVESEQAEIIRQNAKVYGITSKPTDKLVFGLVKGEPEYVAAFKRYKAALRREEDLRNAIDVCRQRGMMIRILAELWLNNYYSEPTVKDNSSKKYKDRAKLRVVNASQEPDF